MELFRRKEKLEKLRFEKRGYRETHELGLRVIGNHASGALTSQVI